MGMVAPPQGIASAYVVFFGVYGDVTRQSLKRNVSRQTLYREAAQTSALLQGAAQAHTSSVCRSKCNNCSNASSVSKAT